MGKLHDTYRLTITTPRRCTSARGEYATPGIRLRGSRQEDSGYWMMLAETLRRRSEVLFR